MIQKLFLLVTMVLCLAACGNSQSVDLTKQTGKPQSFGEAISADNAIAFNDLLMKMQTSDSVAVKVQGTVESVCQAKGCWMNIQDAQAGKSMFVKFKDYGFFMPKDISGREVILQGYAFREVTPVEDLRHFAEDEGKSKAEIEAITQPKEELKFMASGVLLLPQGKK